MYWIPFHSLFNERVCRVCRRVVVAVLLNTEEILRALVSFLRAAVPVADLGSGIWISLPCCFWRVDKPGIWKNQENFPGLSVFTETQKSFPCFLFSLFNWRELPTVSLTPSTNSKPPVSVTKRNVRAAHRTLGCCPEVLSPGSSQRGKGAALQCVLWRVGFWRAGGCNGDRDTPGYWVGKRPGV